jgi:hypothetical protein
MDTISPRHHADDDLDGLSRLVDRHGIDGLLPGAIDRLAALARSVGVAEPVVEALLDEGAPDVVRGRAFARIHRDLESATDRRPPSVRAA